jgi:hypothetical protein
MLGLSRVIVGAVKFTMTASKAMAAAWSEDGSRAETMARVSSSATVAWLTGSAVTGAVRAAHPLAPSALAVALYAVNGLLVVYCLPPTLTARSVEQASQRAATAKSDSVVAQVTASTKAATTAEGNSKTAIISPPPSFLASCKRAFGNTVVARFLVVWIANRIVSQGAASMHDTWEMERFSLAAGQLGSLYTFKSVLSVALQALVAGRVVRRLGERVAYQAALACQVAG